MSASDGEGAGGWARLIGGEALAYARSGVYATTRARIAHHPAQHAPVGVLLVHGVGADRTQFRGLSQALVPTGAWIEAFDYDTRTPFERTLPALASAMARARAHAERLVVVGHSLGGLLLSLVLQDETAPPAHVAGFVAICSPLHGTTRGRLAPWRDVRGITPDGLHVQRLLATRDRLHAWQRPILTIGADRDAFVEPVGSAFLPGHPQVRLSGTGHVASLFDPRTHAAVTDFVRAIARGRGLPTRRPG